MNEETNVRGKFEVVNPPSQQRIEQPQACRSRSIEVTTAKVIARTSVTRLPRYRIARVLCLSRVRESCAESRILAIIYSRSTLSRGSLERRDLCYYRIAATISMVGGRHDDDDNDVAVHRVTYFAVRFYRCNVPYPLEASSFLRWNAPSVILLVVVNVLAI